ncbi:alpha/beta hydrolase [Streptomyces globisporus]|uniref:alpha/beta hydrolase n=1 Tax=Streptomyces globisporus TaxID=1908 RepID=UPI0037FBE90C
MPPVVIVHGLYHRPEHFDAVARGLRSSGVEAIVPELHRGSPAADTEAVQASVDALHEPPLLLGHSYGGSVITGVRGACHLVHLAAFVLDTGESAAALGGASAELRDAIRPEPDGSTSLRPDRAADVLYDDCPEPLAARAVGLLRPQAPGCGRGVPRHHSWRDTPSTYVVCGKDRAIDPALQRTMASRCTEVREWRTGHSPFVGQPDLLVGLLRELLVTGARS